MYLSLGWLLKLSLIKVGKPDMLRIKIESDDSYTYNKILRGLNTTTSKLKIFGREWNVQSINMEAPFSVRCSLFVNDTVVTDKEIRDKMIDFRRKNGKVPSYICCDEDMKKEIGDIYRSAYSITAHNLEDRCYGLKFIVSPVMTNFELM